MDTEKIEAYLQNHEYITLGVSKEELLQQGGQRYFDLLRIVGENPKYADKFCGKLYLKFKGYEETELWKASEVKEFVHRLSGEVPYLFFLAEKEQATLKLLMILECATGESSQEDLALDKKHFNTYLQSQLKGILLMAQKVGYTPERAQSIMDDVYTYFGI